MEILFLLGGAFIIYLVYSVRQGWREGYQRGQAQAVAKGAKPYGKPLGHGFGSAYFLVPKQIIEAGIGIPSKELWQRLADKGRSFLITGHFSRDGQEVITSMEGDGHLLTIAPTRAGKGVSAVIPNLLLYGGSMIVNDIKGENYAVTADWRRKMGHKVLKFAPFDSDTNFWNPFVFIDDDDDGWEQARTFSQLLIPDRGGNEEFWNNEARNLLTGVVLHMVFTLPWEERTMSRLRQLLTQDAVGFEELLAEMCAGQNELVRRAAQAFEQSDEKVRANVLTTLNSHMGIWDSPRLKHMTSTNEFYPARMVLEPVTVYFCIPPGKLDSYAPVIRLFMGMATTQLSEMSRRMDYPILFLLDEFPALGRMKVIEEGLTYLAGYGVNFWLFAQDLKQLAAVYGDKADSIISNCTVKQVFGAADVETAQWVSLMCGETTSPSISYSNERGLTIKDGSMTLSSGARPLLTPNEVMNLPGDHQLLFHRGQQVVHAMKVNYLKDPIFKDKDGRPVYDDNPFHR